MSKARQPPPDPHADLKPLERSDLERLAAELGVQHPEAIPNKSALIDAVLHARGELASEA